MHRLFLPDFHLLQLAQMINEKPQTINEYEAGKAIPNPQVGEGCQQAACGQGCCLEGDTLVPTVCFCGLLACSGLACWRAACLSALLTLDSDPSTVCCRFWARCRVCWASR